ncbi:MAG: transketolase [Elusimicrobia bacterium]|nr:transketolase [Elusimicrobiota bacterium]
MRNAFAQEITALARENPLLVLLAGDIGNRLFDRYKEAAPGRFFNCGVAEANMAGVAAGLALSGLRPVTYTIAPFNTIRCLEQIKLDICCQNLPVIIVGTGAGLAYANLGPTHHSCDDVALMRVLPNMTVLCPADPVELRLLLREALTLPSPVYLRIGKKGEPSVHPAPPPIRIGRALAVAEGSDVCLMSSGTMLSDAIAVREKLAARGCSAQVSSFHTVKPLDDEALAAAAGKFRLVATMEEHGAIGGFGAAVAEWFSDRRLPKTPRLLRLALPDAFIDNCASQREARDAHGLAPDAMAERILRCLD